MGWESDEIEQAMAYYENMQQQPMMAEGQGQPTGQANGMMFDNQQIMQQMTQT